MSTTYCPQQQLYPGCSKSRCASLALTIALVSVVSLGFVSDVHCSSSGDWSFLQNSYWYVPASNLPALFSNTAGGGIFTPIGDQTIFYIQSYTRGYLWGTVATELTVVGRAVGPACFQMVGSVTPEGTVNLSFSPADTSGSPTSGLGTMRFIRGKWKMENQMSSNVKGGMVTHWAYMTQCTAGQPCMQSIPGTDLTIAQLVGECS
jgi:hypothetical protein